MLLSADFGCDELHYTVQLRRAAALLGSGYPPDPQSRDDCQGLFIVSHHDLPLQSHSLSLSALLLSSTSPDPHDHTELSQKSQDNRLS